jgi:hypothetical protein
LKFVQVEIFEIVSHSGDTFDIMNYLFNSGLTGGFADAPTTGFVADGWNWKINYDGGEGENEVVLTAPSPVDMTATPESGTLVLLASGLLGLAWYIRRMKVVIAR